jgi:CHAT domain-containing protein
VKRIELQRHLAPLEDGSALSRDVARIGSGLARLLVAPSVREGLEAMHARPLVVLHDREASRVPWEVLRIGEAHPALGAGLSRRYASESLTVARWRDDRSSTGPLRVLLIVDPTEDLPGAAAEGQALQDLLRARGTTFDVLERGEATRARVLAALATGAFDVLHFAGHAFFDAANPGNGGLLCAGKEILRGADLAGLGTLPALVFCNACEAARVRRRTGRTARPRPPVRLLGARRSMTGIAEAFLSGGVANFMGTHWPVGDDAAFAFSRELYGTLLKGEALGDAVLGARRRVAALPSLDWADYVLYGNAEFRIVST